MTRVLDVQGDQIRVRLLPPAKDGKWCEQERVHEVNGETLHCAKVLAENGDGKKVWSGPCPECFRGNEPVHQFKFWVLPRPSGEQMTTEEIVEFAKTPLEERLHACIDYDGHQRVLGYVVSANFGDITNLRKGTDIFLRRLGNSPVGPMYTVVGIDTEKSSVLK